MICPSCGCQQRDADICIQCRAPVSLKEREELSLSHSSSAPSEGLQPKPPQQPPPVPRREAMRAKTAPRVLITTTQRIEGKRIRRYFGLIYANIVIESADRLSAPESARHRKQLQDGMARVMQALKEEAAILGANAVVASSLQFQRIDGRSLLLSAMGTAVQLEDPR